MSHEMSQDLCVSWHNGNRAGTQHGDFAQCLLYIPGARQEVVSGERTILKVPSRSFQQLFERASWSFRGILCLKMLEGFSYTVLQAPARYVVILGRRVRGKEVLSYNVNWVYCCLAEYFGSLLWQSLCHKHFLALGTRSNHSSGCLQGHVQCYSSSYCQKMDASLASHCTHSLLTMLVNRFS